MNIPIIEAEGYQGSQEIRLDARFLKEKKLFLFGEITPDSAVELTQKLIFLENMKSNRVCMLSIINYVQSFMKKRMTMINFIIVLFNI